MEEVIEVRQDERFDVDRLTGWMAGNGTLPDGSPTVRQFAGGKANLTYLLDFPGGEQLVLRRPPLGPVAESSHDMTREYTVLSRLWKGFDKAPRAIALCEDPDVIGAPFFLMEPKPGVVIRDVVPDVFGGGRDEGANRKLSTVVIDTLVELHSVDPAECGLEDLGHPDGFLERQVEGWWSRWERAKDDDDPIADEVGMWLRSGVPQSGPPTLIHNDWRLDNMAVSPADPGRLCGGLRLGHGDEGRPSRRRRDADGVLVRRGRGEVDPCADAHHLPRLARQECSARPLRRTLR